MNPLRAACAATAMTMSLLGFALRSDNVIVAAADDKFDLAWADLTDLHKADREKLAPAVPKPVWPEPAIEKPHVPTPVVPATPVKVTENAPAPTSKPKEKSNWCTRHGMHMVYHHHRWWCRKPR